jgi:Protein of unknown function (DUF3386)
VARCLHAAVAALVAAAAVTGAAKQIRTAADLVGPKAWDGYFPFRLGDSWTYDWRTEGPLAQGGTAARTRVFDGTSFIGDSVGYKLVADDGAYFLYTFDKGILALHSSSDTRRLLYYDPPVVVAAPDLTVGETRTVEQADGTRRFKTTFVGLEDVTVPLGSFSKVVVMRLEMEGADYSSEATHYFAPRAGLVAYKYAVKATASAQLLLGVDASLRLARLAGTDIRTVADLDRLPAPGAGVASGEDASIRDAIKYALERRYTWNAPFPGVKGGAVLTETGKPQVRGTFTVAPDLSVKIDAPDDAARATLRNEISSFVTQRKALAFDLQYAETTFVKAGTRPDGAVVITPAGDTVATTYVVKDGELVEVGRSMGRVSYVARDRRKLKTEDGRTISVEYDVAYRSNETGKEISVERTRDSYVRVGDYWVPSGRRVERTSDGQPPITRELILTDLSTP